MQTQKAFLRASTGKEKDEDGNTECKQEGDKRRESIVKWQYTENRLG